MPHGFNAVPITVYNNDDIHDDVSYDGCPYISNIEADRVDNETIFGPYEWMKEGVRSPMMKEFNLTAEYFDSQDYHGVYHMADTAVALDYEGYPEHETYYTDDEWELTHEFQKVYLSLRDSKNARALEVSRMLRKPMDLMRFKA